MAQDVIDYLIKVHGFTMEYTHSRGVLVSPCLEYQIHLWDSEGTVGMFIKDIDFGDYLFKGHIPTDTDNWFDQVKMILKFTKTI